MKQHLPRHRLAKYGIPEPQAPIDLEPEDAAYVYPQVFTASPEETQADEVKLHDELLRFFHGAIFAVLATASVAGFVYFMVRLWLI